MSIAHLFQPGATFSVPISFFGPQRIEINSPTDEKIAHVWQRALSPSCISDLFTGITGSLITKNPLPLLAGISACLPGASAQQKVGSQFQVNTYTAGNQWYPSVSSLSNNDFVVTWFDGSGEDGNGEGVFGQIFNATGSKVGSQFQINTLTSGNQYAPSVSSLSNGNFVVAWQDGTGLVFDVNGNVLGYGNGGNVFAQIFNPIGAKIGSQFQINTYMSNAPSVSSLSNSSFVVAWYDLSGHYGINTVVFGQIFNATGSKVSSQFQVDTSTNGNQILPSVSSLSNGNLVITWFDQVSGVFGQIFNATGAKVSSQFQLGTSGTGSQISSSVSSLSNGDFVAVWGSFGIGTGNGDGVYGQIFNTTGAKVGSQFQVNTNTTGNQQYPSATSLSNGNFLVAWEDDSGEDGSGDGVFAQIFNPTGSKVGGQFQVNTYTTGNQQSPSVTSLNNGDFVVTWEDSQLDGNGTGIFAQIFNVSDVPLASTGYSTTGVPLASTGYSTTGVPLASTGYSTTGVPIANTGNSATSSSAGGSGTSGISISTGNPGSMGTTGLPGTSTSASSLIPPAGLPQLELAQVSA